MDHFSDKINFSFRKLLNRRVQPILLLPFVLLLLSVSIMYDASAKSFGINPARSSYFFEGTNPVQLSSNSMCVNGMLTLKGVTNNVLKIEWKRDGKVVGTSIVSPPIATVAGGSEGDNADQLRFPVGVYVDTANNIFIADQYNHRVQKWAPGATEGITIAGGNGQGHAADQLNYPYSVVGDKAGNIYISDAGNHRVQKWAPGATEGVTIAGGNGRGRASNQLAFPYGLAIDKAGAIYIADYYNHRIQKWLPGAATGVTVAGGNGDGDAANQLQYPNGVFVDNKGQIYIADSRNDRIQRWTPGATKGVTVAGGKGRGNNANQLYYPTMIYVQDNGTMYIADVCNNRIQRWVDGASSGANIAGNSTTDQLRYPNGVYLDTKGNMYVSDEYSHRVKKYANGALTTDYTFPASGPGTYTADIVLRNNSIDTTGTIVIDPKPLVAPISGKTTLCIADNTALSSSTLNGKWSSMNDAVATVNADGLVTAKLEGSTLISYTTVNEHGCTATATTLVTVNPIPITPVINGTDSLIENAKGLLTSDKPGGKWSSADESIARINQAGEITGLSLGIAEVTYEIINSFACKATAKIKVTIQAHPTASADSMASFVKIRKTVITMMPAVQNKNYMPNNNRVGSSLKVVTMGNPSTTYFTVRVSGNEQTPVKLQVTDLFGRITEINLALTANNIVRFGDSYPKGIYIAEFVQGQQRQVIRLMKL